MARKVLAAGGRRAKGRGFTLVELLVVIAIIALLVAMLMPSLIDAREMTLRASCATRLHAVGVAMTSYADGYSSGKPSHWGQAIVNQP